MMIEALRLKFSREGFIFLLISTIGILVVMSVLAQCTNFWNRNWRNITCGNGQHLPKPFSFSSLSI